MPTERLPHLAVLRRQCMAHGDVPARHGETGRPGSRIALSGAAWP